MPLFAGLTRRKVKIVDGFVHQRQHLKEEIIFDGGEEGPALTQSEQVRPCAMAATLDRSGELGASTPKLRCNADTGIDREAAVFVGQHLFGITTLDQALPDKGAQTDAQHRAEYPRHAACSRAAASGPTAFAAWRGTGVD